MNQLCEIHNWPDDRTKKQGRDDRFVGHLAQLVGCWVIFETQHEGAKLDIFVGPTFNQATPASSTARSLQCRNRRRNDLSPVSKLIHEQFPL